MNSTTGEATVVSWLTKRYTIVASCISDSKSARESNRILSDEDIAMGDFGIEGCKTIRAPPPKQSYKYLACHHELHLYRIAKDGLREYDTHPWAQYSTKQSRYI